MTVTERSGIHNLDADVLFIGFIKEVKKILAISGSLSSGQKTLFLVLFPLIPNAEVRLAEASTQNAILVFS